MLLSLFKNCQSHKRACMAEGKQKESFAVLSYKRKWIILVPLIREPTASFLRAYVSLKMGVWPTTSWPLGHRLPLRTLPSGDRGLHQSLLVSTWRTFEVNLDVRFWGFVLFFFYSALALYEYSDGFVGEVKLRCKDHVRSFSWVVPVRQYSVSTTATRV